MKKIIGLFSIIIFNYCVYAQTATPLNTEWIVKSSKITFKIKNAGFFVDGKLNELNAKIYYDETKKTGNSIEAKVESKTVNTGNNTRDGHLKKEDYFNTTAYPIISMKATQFAEIKGVMYGQFKLTMKGITKEVYVPFSFIKKENEATFKATFKINRLDYGVGSSSLVLSNDVIISIEVNTTKK